VLALLVFKVVSEIVLEIVLEEIIFEDISGGEKGVRGGWVRDVEGWDLEHLFGC